MHFRTLSSLSAILAIAQALSPSEWRAQSIYQVMTDRFARTDGSTTASCDLGNYCGGTWEGLINHLDYIQDMGFTAVWISPVVKNLNASTADGSSYHGYWATSIYEVNTNFGSAADLVSLSDALHKRGMYLMVDIVTNHMGYAGCGECVDYSKFSPFNNESYYHPFCLIDYNNKTSMKICWEGDNTVSLPDLRTEDSTVDSMWQEWIKSLVANYTIDGLRIDSAGEVNQASLTSVESASGVYAIGEVFDNNVDLVCGYQNYISGLLNYPLYYNITSAFSSTNGSMQILANGINTLKSTCMDTTLLGAFLENHDNPRFASLTSDITLAKNAIAFAMLADGIPIVYQGQEQHFSGGSVPYNREAIWLSGYNKAATLYTHIAKINAIRTQAIKNDEQGYLTTNAVPLSTNQHTIVMRKGGNDTQVIGVFSNVGAGGRGANVSVSASGSGFDGGMQLTEILSCGQYTTDGQGNLGVSVIGGEPLVLYSTLQMKGSGLCGY